MGAPEAFEAMALDFLRRGPTFGRTQHDHRPVRAGDRRAFAGFLLNMLDFENAVLDGGSHCLVHGVVVGAFDEIGSPAVAAHQALELVVRDASEERRVVDLVSVEMQDGQHGAIARRVEEFVDVPRRGEGAGFGFAVADNGGNDEFRAVEGRAACVRQDVAEFSAFVNGAGRFGSAVAADSAGEGKLLEKFSQAVEVFALFRIHLGVSAFEVGGAEDAGRAVSRASEEDHVEVVLLDEAIEVHINKGEAGARSPVAEQAILDVLGAEGFLQQGIVEQVDHAEAEEIASAPVGVRLAESVSVERGSGNGGTGRAIGCDGLIAGINFRSDGTHAGTSKYVY